VPELPAFGVYIILLARCGLIETKPCPDRRGFPFVRIYMSENHSSDDEGSMLSRHFEAKFSMGQVVSTPGALAALEAAGIMPSALLARHQTGDWGVVSPADGKANDHALFDGSRLLSSYAVGKGKVWIITEADRSATTLLLPSEY
jgi:hypothetical protein